MKKRISLVGNSDNNEPVWAEYITENNLPTEDLQCLCSIIGLEATKKLMLNYAGCKFSIHNYCNQKYKKQYIINNYDGTKKSINKIVKACDTNTRYVYKVIKEYKEGKEEI